MNLCPKSGKRSYNSRAQARDSMRHAGNRIRVYFCDGEGGCHCFHVTSQAYRQTISKARRTNPTPEEL